MQRTLKRDKGGNVLHFLAKKPHEGILLLP